MQTFKDDSLFVELSSDEEAQIQGGWQRWAWGQVAKYTFNQYKQIYYSNSGQCNKVKSEKERAKCNSRDPQTGRAMAR